jgi:hypothetical protein
MVQVTAVFVAFRTVALNCDDVLRLTLAVVGVIVT